MLIGSFLVLLLLASMAKALTPSESPSTASSRRTFVSQSAIGVGAFLGGQLSFPLGVKAYERRDVGDPSSRSPETAAMNEQAYQTQNRLEKQGFKLDTAEEQKAQLSTALSDFSYDSEKQLKKAGKDKKKGK